ncbi:MAG: hypothetical protein AB1752_13585 [Candidatus Zixiibacteriota bacterium]
MMLTHSHTSGQTHRIARGVHVRVFPIFAFLMLLGSQAAAITVVSEVVLEESRRWLLLDGGGWVTVEKGRVEFYSPSGERIKLLDRRGNEFLVGSFATKAVGILSYADNQPQTLRPLSFTLLSPTGTELARLTDPPFANAIVSPAGNAFVGIDGAEGLPSSLLRVYDARGNLTDTIRVERYEGGKFTRDGSRFLFEGMTAGLQIYDLEARATNAVGRFLRWGVSHDGATLAAILADRLLIYRGGKLTQTLALTPGMGEIRAVTLSPQGAHAAIISATQAALVRIEPPSIVWNTGIGDTTWNFRSADCLDDGSMVALGIDYDPDLDSPERHLKSRCLLFDAQGRMLHTVEDTPAKWNGQFPAVRFDPERGTVAFINRDRMKILALDQTEP